MLSKKRFTETWYQWVAILVITLVLALVLFVVIEPAAGFYQKNQFYNVPLHSVKEANYNVDTHAISFAKLDLRIIAEVIREHEGPSIDMADRMISVTSVLLSPVPTITPYQPELSATGTNDTTNNRNTDIPVDATASTTSSSNIPGFTTQAAHTATLSFPMPLPSNTPTMTPTFLFSPSPEIVLPTFTPSSTLTPTKMVYIPPTPSSTPKPAKTKTSSPTTTSTRTMTPTSTPTLTNTPTPTSTPTLTNTPIPTSTPTATSTHTNTPTETQTSTQTATSTATQTPTATSTANSPACPSEPINLTATQDSWIGEAQKDQNHGSDTQLITQPTAKFNRQTLIQFDLVSLPQNCIIKNATLIVNQTISSDQVIINIFRITQSWNEMTVTWNTPPTHVTTIVASFPGQAVTPVYRYINLTNLVSSWYDKSFGNFGVLFTAEVGNGAIAVESRESSRPPVLQIELGNP